MKHAICVGINDYSWLGGGNSLRGCVNDAREWADLLLSFYRFTDVHLLLDGDATPQAFRAALSRIAERAVPGDTVAITYSGHGTRVADADGDEPDGYDEAIVLTGALYTDDELAGDLKIFRPDIPVTIVADSCHSGTMLKLCGLTGSTKDDLKPRFLDPSLFKRGAAAPALRRLHHRFGAPREGGAAAASSAPAPRHALLAGCKSHETSMDAFIANRYHGALTYFATRILEENPTLTWLEVATRLRPRIGFFSPQTPQVEGDVASRVFS